MKNELFDFQKVGSRWLAAQKTALLADEQRLGKAVQSIAALDIIEARNALVVCRGVARANWREEFKRWSPRQWRTSIAYGKHFEMETNPGPDHSPTVVITSYELLDSVLARLPDEFRFCAAIIDESHYAKTPGAKRTKSVYGRDGIPKFSKRIWCTTGTPIPNHAGELWTLLFTFGATKLGYWEFVKRFCTTRETGFGTQITGTNLEKVGELRAILDKKMLRRTTEEVSVQLPKMSFSTVMVPPGKVDLGSTIFWKYMIPTDRTKELNDLIEKELGIVNGILADKSLSGDFLEALKAEAKSISTLRKYVALQKLAPACELIASELEANAYRKCVIFAHHRDCIAGAQRMLYKFYPVTMYGGSNPKRLEMNLKNFQKPNHKCRVFIGQINAAGTSISLNAANHIFFLEESFVPGDNMQAAMRCGGVNQPNPIFVRTFCLENSFDRRVQDILREKMIQISKVYGKEKSGKAETPELPLDMI